MSSRYIGKGRIVERSTRSDYDVPATEEIEGQSPTPSHNISPLGLSTTADTEEYNNFENDNSDAKERRQQQSSHDTDGGSSIIGYEDPIRLNESTHCKFISAILHIFFLCVTRHLKTFNKPYAFNGE